MQRTPIHLVVIFVLEAVTCCWAQTSGAPSGVSARVDAAAVSFKFLSTPLSACVKYLSEQSGIPMVMSAAVDQKQQVTFAGKNMPLGRALHWVTFLARASYQVRANDVLVGSPDEIMEALAELVVFDIRDLITTVIDFPGPDTSVMKSRREDSGGGAVFGGDEPTPTFDADAIAELVRRSVDPGSWDLLGASLRASGGTLFAVNTPENLAGVRAFLAELREHSRQLVTVEAWVLSMDSSVWKALLGDAESTDGRVILDAAGVDALLLARTGVSVVSHVQTTGMATQEVNARFGKDVAWLADYDVEVAQGTGCVDPIVGALFAGARMRVRPIPTADGAEVILRLSLQLTEIEEMREMVYAAPSAGEPVKVQLPSVACAQVQTSLRVPVGVGCAFTMTPPGTRLPPGSKTVMLVRPWLMRGGKQAKETPVESDTGAGPEEATTPAVGSDLAAALAETVTLEFLEAPLSAVLVKLQDSTSLPLVLEPGREFKPVTCKLENVPVRSALETIFTSIGAAWTIEDGVVFVSSRGGIDRRRLVFKVYELADVLSPVEDFPSPIMMGIDRYEGGGAFGISITADEPYSMLGEDELVDLVRGRVEPRSWDEEGRTIEIRNRVLLVSCTEEVQAGIAALLAKVREGRGELVTVQARHYLLPAADLAEVLGTRQEGDGLLLSASARRGLDERGKLQHEVSICSFNSQRVYGFSGAVTQYQRDLDVEVTQSIAAADPTISQLGTGMVLDVRTLLSADHKHANLTLRVQLAGLESTAMPRQAGFLGASVESIGTSATVAEDGKTVVASTADTPPGVLGNGAGVELPEVFVDNVSTTVQIPLGFGRVFLRRGSPLPEGQVSVLVITPALVESPKK